MIDPNLTLTGYGVTLHRLTHDKIEMLRQWRNDPKIQQYMIYRDYITPEMQEAWFQKINNDNNFYFIVEYKGREIGMVNLKDLDYTNKKAENGVFIYDDTYRSTDVAYRSMLLMYEWFFLEMGFTDTYSHVQSTNIASLRLGIYMGCKKIDEDNELQCEIWNLNYNDFLNNHNRVRFLKRWNYYNH